MHRHTMFVRKGVTGLYKAIWWTFGTHVFGYREKTIYR